MKRFFSRLFGKKRASQKASDVATGGSAASGADSCNDASKQELEACIGGIGRDAILAGTPLLDLAASDLGASSTGVGAAGTDVGAADGVGVGSGILSHGAIVDDTAPLTHGAILDDTTPLTHGAIVDDTSLATADRHLVEIQRAEVVLDAQWEQIPPDVTTQVAGGAEVSPVESGAEGAAPDLAAVEGIATQVAIGRFVDAARGIEANWTSLTPVERAEGLGDAANAELAAIGVPETGIVIKDMPGRAGELDFQVWNINLNQGNYQQPNVFRGMMANMADTVYHEARHAEQWHKMARLEAGMGHDAAYISRMLHLPAHIAADAASKPLDTTSAEGAAAEPWHRSVYGAGSAHRNQTLTDLTPDMLAASAALQTWSATLNEYQAALSTGDTAAIAAAAARRDAAKDVYDAAQAKSAASFAAYRALPEEVDAWNVGGAVNAAYMR